MANSDKTFFDKKIIYLDYMERGEKVKNGGFLKWEAKGDASRIQLQIRGLYPTDTLQGEIMILSDGNLHTADRVQLHYGTGEYAACWKNDNLAGTGVTFTSCDGILIRISENRLLKGQWRESKPAEKHEPENRGDSPVEEFDVEIVEMERKTEPEQDTMAQDLQEKERKEEQGETAQRLQAAETERKEEQVETSQRPQTAETERNGEQVETAQRLQATETERKEEQSETAQRLQVAGTGKKRERGGTPLARDKWEQLNREYPKIHPFGDMREYLSIAPRDFVILAREYHNLVQNSFLLHGYYNYGHVILTRIKNKEEENFYLGVPGVYFEREKQAALMFGFEGFESGTEHITDGGFGYYMKRVEI